MIAPKDHIVAFDARWIRQNEFDGIGRFAYELLRAMHSRLGQQLKAIIPPRDCPEILGQLIKQRQISTITAASSILDHREPLTLPKILVRNDCSIYYSPHYLNWPFTRSIKAIGTIHDLIPFHNQSTTSSLAWRLFYASKIPTQILLRKFNQLITVSEFSRSTIANEFGVDLKRISVAYPGVKTTFMENEASSANAFSAYGLPPNYILGICRAEPYKNMETLVRAYSSLAETTRAVHPLVLAGSRHHLDNVKDLSPIAQQLLANNQLRLPGFIDEKALPALYKNAAIVVLPSKYEGFGLPLLEAMASGATCIASNIPSHREIAENLVDYFSPEDFLQLATLLAANLSSTTNSQVQSGRANQERARLFHWDRTAEAVIQTFG